MAILGECPICRKKQRIKNKICKCGENLDRAKRSSRIKFYISYRLPGGKQRMEVVSDTPLRMQGQQRAKERPRRRKTPKSWKYSQTTRQPFQNLQNGT
jgi:hypothetical protein